MAHFFNIGLDFGTAFTKCMIRDRAGNHFPLRTELCPDGLFPSVVCIDDDKFFVPENASAEGANSFHGLKMALFQSLRGQRNDPWITQLGAQWANFSSDEVQLWVERLISLFLGVMIQRAKEAIQLRQPDFGQDPEDGMLITMAIPCAHASDNAVQETYLNCLQRGNLLSKFELKGIAWENLVKYCDLVRVQDQEQVFCEVYPEASANMGAFVNSRAGRPGIYVLTDVGAGTVDCSVFIYRQGTADGKDFTYLYVDVVPLGSSRIETLASHFVSADLKLKIRRAKEGVDGVEDVAYKLSDLLNVGIKLVQKQLEHDVGRTLGLARQKLLLPRQWEGLTVLMAGGGSSLKLYPKCVHSVIERHWHFKSPIESLPCPENIEYPDMVGKEAFFRRFSVAYGLSFGVDLPRQRFPDEVPPPAPPEPEQRYPNPSDDGSN